MPLYDFECPGCKFEWEELLKKPKHVSHCPECGHAEPVHVYIKGLTVKGHASEKIKNRASNPSTMPVHVQVNGFRDRNSKKKGK